MNKRKSIGVFIPTIGRPELKNMLLSLKDQLKGNDTIYIAIDGKQYRPQVTEIINSIDFKCNVVIFNVPKQLGNYGYSIREKYHKELNTDYIMFGDDDDIYLPDAISKIRKQIDKMQGLTLFFFRIWFRFDLKTAYWQFPRVEIGNSSMQNCVIPNITELLPSFGTNYNADTFYNVQLAENFEMAGLNVKFVDEFIYAMRPNLYGRPDIDSNYDHQFELIL